MLSPIMGKFITSENCAANLNVKDMHFVHNPILKYSCMHILNGGEDCIYHLNGIFAFGLWDEQKQQLVLARDHLGVKPLFYAQRGIAILFGSELKALLAHPAVKTEIDAIGLAEVFGFRRTPGSGVFRD